MVAICRALLVVSGGKSCLVVDVDQLDVRRRGGVGVDERAVVGDRLQVKVQKGSLNELEGVHLVELPTPFPVILSLAKIILAQDPLSCQALDSKSSWSSGAIAD